MSSQPTIPSLPSDVPVVIPVLGLQERRVLGVLVEKAKTTPDAYPLSLNALVTGCNQKSNRDPVLDMTDTDVEQALATCQKQLLVIRISGGGRVERWRHNLYDGWKVNKVELAVIGELLLRGAQTEGDVRTRASRMEPIADLDALRPVLRSLAERKLVVFLGPEGRRGTTVTHGFHAAQELERLRSRHPAEGGEVEERGSRAAPVADNQFAGMQTQLATLQTQVADLQKTVGSLGEQLRSLKEQLGA